MGRQKLAYYLSTVVTIRKDDGLDKLYFSQDVYEIVQFILFVDIFECILFYIVLYILVIWVLLYKYLFVDWNKCFYYP